MAPPNSGMGPSSVSAALALETTGFCECNITMTAPRITTTPSAPRIHTGSDKERLMIENFFAAYSMFSAGPWGPPMPFTFRSRCVMGEDIVAIFRRRVAREAGLVQCLVARLSVLEVSEPPAARLGILLGVLYHDLDIH